MRFVRPAALLTVAAGVLASSASAGGYTDASYATPIGTVGVPYSHQIAWKPGNGCPPYSYHLDPNNFLPPGLSLNSSTGWITGTPTKAGTFSFYVSQIDLCGVEGQGNSVFQITIKEGASAPSAPPPLVVSSVPPPTAEVGVSYATSLNASGGGGTATPVWSITGGQLPPGLTLASNGHISGTPSAAGTYTFTATVSNGSSSASRSLTITVVAGITFNADALLPTAEVRTPYSAPLATVLGISGGTPPYRYAPLSGFPYGVGFDPATGTIFGSPRAPGVLHLTIAISDANNASRQLTLSLLVVPRLHIVPIDLHRGRAGTSYRAKIAVTGGKVPAWSISFGTLPTGLTLNANTGVIKGVPVRKGSFGFTVSVRDSLGAKVSIRYVLVIGR